MLRCKICFLLILSVLFWAVQTIQAKEPMDINNLAVWHFNEGAGLQVIDSTDGGFDGLLSGGRFGNGLHFDALNDYVHIQNSTSFDVTQITIEAWVKLDRMPGDSEFAVVSRWSGAGLGGGNWILSIDSLGQLRFNLQYDAVQSMGTLAARQWYHVAATFDGTQIKLYINGTLDTTVTATGDLGTASNDVEIGRNVHYFINGAVNPWLFHGTIDEVRISDTARSPSQFCLNGECVDDAGTVALWHCNEACGDTAYDQTANNNYGLISSASRVGPPAWTTVKSPRPTINSYAIKFSGSSCLANFLAIHLLDPNPAPNQLTIEAWVKPDSFAVGLDDRSAIYVRRSANADHRLDILSDGTLSGEIAGNLSPTVPVYGSTPLPLGVWSHIALTYDGTTENLYLNGNLDGSAYYPSTILWNEGFNFIGGDYGLPPYGPEGFYRFFNGVIDEVRVSDIPRDIYPVSCSLLTHNTYEILNASTTDTVRWTSKAYIGVDSVVLFFSSDNGATWTRLNKSTLAASIYVWTIPCIKSDSCRLLAVAYDAAAGTAPDTSDVSFSIFATKPGDANGSGTYTLGDVIAIVNYIFNKDGCTPKPLCWLSDLLCRGDWNGSGTVSLADVIQAVNFIFNKPGGPWNAVPVGVCCL